MTSHFLKTVVNSPLKHSATTLTAAVNTAKPALLVTHDITLTLNCNTSLSPFPSIHSQSFDSSAPAAKRKKAIVLNSAQATLLNWLSIKSVSGTSTPNDSLSRLSRNQTISQSSMGISLIKSTKKQIERRSQEEERDRSRKERETFWMSFQRGNQTQRRKGKITPVWHPNPTCLQRTESVYPLTPQDVFPL